MKTKTALTFIVFVLLTKLVFSQGVKGIHTFVFQPVYGNAKLQLNDSMIQPIEINDTRIETLKFYISEIQLMNNNTIVWKEANSFHLLDASREQSLTFTSNTSNDILFNQVKFNVGIDSVTNVSGAMGGDLDPTKGMYWTWQNGYINFKLEGRSSLCKTRNNEFQFHLGGYQFPDNTLQTVILKTDSPGRIIINMDIKQFIDQIDLSKQNHVMSPGKDAVLLSGSLSKIFSIQQR